MSVNIDIPRHWDKPNDMTDVVFNTTNGEKLYFYKILLHMRSEYFRLMLSAPMKESKSAEIPLQCSSYVLNIILGYIYSLCAYDEPPSAMWFIQRDPPTHQSQMSELIYISQQYLLPDIQSACDVHLRSKGSYHTIESMNRFLVYDLPEYTSHMIRLLHEENFIREQNIGSLSPNLIKTLFDKKEDFLNFLLKWLAADPENSEYLDDILKAEEINAMSEKMGIYLYKLRDYCCDEKKEHITNHLLKNYANRLENESMLQDKKPPLKPPIKVIKRATPRILSADKLETDVNTFLSTIK